MARRLPIHGVRASGEVSDVGGPEGEQMARWRVAIRTAEAPRSREASGDGATGAAPMIDGENDDA